MDTRRVDDAIAAVVAGHQPSALESAHLEFKAPGRTVKETLTILADAVVCFANADGGSVVVGIVNRVEAGARAVVGVPGEYSLDVIRRGIFDRTSPPMSCFVTERDVGGQRVVVIDVPAGVATYSNASGTATRRVGTECRPFTPEQQREVLFARGQADWSAEPCALGIGDLSATSFDRLRRLLRGAGKDDVAAQDDARLLTSLRLLRQDGRLTNAGALLLAPEDALAATIPTYGYSYQYRPSAGAEATFTARGRRSLLAAVEVLIEAVEPRVSVHPLNLAGGVQLRLSDYPLHAVRELVVNALVHRSYHVPGTVDVEHTPQHLAVTSPGGLVAGVTPQNILTHPSTPRHRLLTESVAVLQLAERTGQGVDRVYREMLRSGKEPPAFEDPGDLVRAILPGGTGNDAFVRFVADLSDDLGRDVEVLLALSLLRRTATIDAVRLGAVIQRGVLEAQGVLSRLDQAGLVEPTRRTLHHATPSYRLRATAIAAMPGAVGYRRRMLDEADRKVVEHVREYGHITNRTLQRLFDVNVYTARNMLADLRGRGLVVKVGAARGGPGVRYGPGPRFPVE